MGFHFDIRYKPGATNKIVDALSREYAGQLELTNISTTCGVEWADLLPEIQHVPFIQQVWSDLEKGKEINGYSLDNGTLRYKGRLVILPNSNIGTTSTGIPRHSVRGTFRGLQNLSNISSGVVLARIA